MNTWRRCGLPVVSSSEAMIVTATPSGRGKIKKMKKVTVERPRSFEADTAQKWWIVILQSSVGDDSLKCQIKKEKTGDSYACYS